MRTEQEKTFRSELSDTLEVEDHPLSEHRDAIFQALVKHNIAAGPPAAAQLLAILIRNSLGRVTGGLWAQSLYNWLHIEMLIVPETMRGAGVGTRLIATAEEAARQRGCLGVWLDTFSFQAPDFYRRLGYATAGTIHDHPIGGARYFLLKRLD